MNTLFRTLMIGGGAAILAACGGGNGSSSDADGKAPTSLFPHSVLNGMVDIVGNCKLRLTVRYNNSDITQGCTYDALITFPKGEQATITGSNMRQLGESEPGHLVFSFDEYHVRPELYGRLALDLPASGADDMSRNGKVEASTTLEYRNETGTRNKINISGGTVKIEWDNVN